VRIGVVCQRTSNNKTKVNRKVAWSNHAENYLNKINSKMKDDEMYFPITNSNQEQMILLDSALEFFGVIA
jgi:hypothetical protein